MISPCLSLDSGPSYDILNLADVANDFDSMPQSVASDAQRSSFDLDKRLMMVVSALVSRRSMA